MSYTKNTWTDGVSPLSATRMNNLEDQYAQVKAELAEAGTSDITVHAKNINNDGAGSGLDADTLDGVEGSGYQNTAFREFVIGSYTGDGTATRDISLGFTPVAVFVLKNDSRLEGTAGVYGGLAITGSPVYDGENVIVIGSGKFTLYHDGGNRHVNTSGSTYHYMAFK